MAHEEVEFGRHYTGVLHDQVGGSFVPATLNFTEQRGAQVEVAFMSQPTLGDFPAQRGWFNHSQIAIPVNLNFYSAELRLGLYNTSMVKVQPGPYVTMGTFTAAEVVFQDRDVPVSEPLLVAELQSRIDGLADLTHLRASDVETATDDDGRIQALHITVKSPDAWVWQQGDAEVSIQVYWRGSPGNEDVHVAESVVLSTKYPAPRPIADHLDEQDKARAFVSVLVDGPAHYRGHAIRDSTITARLMSGEIYGHPLVTLLSHCTLTEHVAPYSRGDPWPKLNALGRGLRPEDFAAWSDALDPKWSRAFASFLELMSRDRHSIADRLINIGIAIEMAGRLLPEADDEAWSYRGKQRTFSTFAYRCVMEVGADWSSIADSPRGVASAIRWAYTSSKHPKDEPPSQRERYLISLIMMTVMRLIAIRRANPSGEMISSYVGDWQFRQLGEITFQQARVRISDEGSFYSVEGADDAARATRVGPQDGEGLPRAGATFTP